HRFFDLLAVGALAAKRRIFEPYAHVPDLSYGTRHDRANVDAEAGHHSARLGRNAIEQIQVSGEAEIIRRETERIVGGKHEAVARCGTTAAPVEGRTETQKSWAHRSRSSDGIGTEQQVPMRDALLPLSSDTRTRDGRPAGRRTGRSSSTRGLPPPTPASHAARASPSLQSVAREAH